MIGNFEALADVQNLLDLNILVQGRIAITFISVLFLFC